MWIEAPKPFEQLVKGLDPQAIADAISAGVGPLHKGKYLHWDELRRRQPSGGLTHDQWWLATKLARLGSSRHLPLNATDDTPFQYSLVDPVLEGLHRIDQQTSGRIAMPDEVTDPAIRDRYIVSSLIEEAIASSQLEGAATTRRVARDMIKSGRKPRDRAEQMILNNYTAMSLIRSELRGSQITPDEVYELHRVVTEGTLDDPLWAGRPQTTSDERVRVFYGGSDTVVHVPPPASELPKRIERMCDFASDPGNGFVHPVLKAIILHFWLAYDHPFEDGNGRTARALFYWSLMRDDYWLFEFISISRIIKSAQAKYERAFLHSESDGNDLTYFLLHQLSVIDQAISELYSYLDAKVAEAQELERMLRTTGLLNHRQLALVAHALRHPEAVYTYISHAKSHSVVRQTARNDLLELEQMELLTSSVVKRVRRFTPTDQLEKRIRQLD